MEKSRLFKSFRITHILAFNPNLNDRSTLRDFSAAVWNFSTTKITSKGNKQTDGLGELHFGPAAILKFTLNVKRIQHHYKRQRQNSLIRLLIQIFLSEILVPFPIGVQTGRSRR